MPCCLVWRCWGGLLSWLSEACNALANASSSVICLYCAELEVEGAGLLEGCFFVGWDLAEGCTQPLQSWSFSNLWEMQKLTLQFLHRKGITSFFLQPFTLHLLGYVFILGILLQLFSMCWLTLIFGSSPGFTGIGSLHFGQMGTLASTRYCSGQLCLENSLWSSLV